MELDELSQFAQDHRLWAIGLHVQRVEQRRDPDSISRLWRNFVFDAYLRGHADLAEIGRHVVALARAFGDDADLVPLDAIADALEHVRFRIYCELRHLPAPPVVGPIIMSLLLQIGAAPRRLLEVYEDLARRSEFKNVQRLFILQSLQMLMEQRVRCARPRVPRRVPFHPCSPLLLLALPRLQFEDLTRGLYRSEAIAGMDRLCLECSTLLESFTSAGARELRDKFRAIRGRLQRLT
jgi:hypothetical protein